MSKEMLRRLEKTLGNKIEHLKSDKAEISDLLSIAERDIKDSKVKAISNDRRYTAAYNAALQLCTVLIRNENYRIKGTAHHYNTFKAAGIILGEKHQSTIDYFDSCRNKRNRAEYDRVLNISDTELDELIDEAEKFMKLVKGILR